MPISASAPGHRQVAQVQLVEVDPVGAQPAQRVDHRPAQVLSASASSPVACRLALVEGVAPLGGDHRLVAAAGEGPPEHPLAVPGPVRVGGVEERHPQVEGPADRPHRLVVVDRAPAQRLGALGPGAADRPAPHAEGADLDAAAAQRPRLTAIDRILSPSRHPACGRRVSTPRSRSAPVRQVSAGDGQQHRRVLPDQAPTSRPTAVTSAADLDRTAAGPGRSTPSARSASGRRHHLVDRPGRQRPSGAAAGQGMLGSAPGARRRPRSIPPPGRRRRAPRRPAPAGRPGRRRRRTPSGGPAPSAPRCRPGTVRAGQRGASVGKRHLEHGPSPARTSSVSMPTAPAGSSNR